MNKTKFISSKNSEIFNCIEADTQHRCHQALEASVSSPGWCAICDALSVLLLCTWCAQDASAKRVVQFTSHTDYVRTMPRSARRMGCVQLIASSHWTSSLGRRNVRRWAAGTGIWAASGICAVCCCLQNWPACRVHRRRAGDSIYSDPPIMLRTLTRFLSRSMQ